MQTETMRKFKLFPAWQDEKEENWLRQMSLQGWHLSRLGFPGFYFFEKGAPQDYAYRLDFITDSKKKQDYYQIFRDAGWEHLGEMSAWQYFRKPSAGGSPPEIYTDPQSKSQKYRRLLGFLLIFLPLLMINSRTVLEHGDSFAGGIIAAFYFVIFILYIYAVIKIALRVIQLDKK